MKRREFMLALGGAVALPFTARAQQSGKVPQIGILVPGSSELSGIFDGFYQGLKDLGYIEGQNIGIERRYGESKLERLPALAADLVRLKVDVIVAFSTPPARAAKQATKTIPIVAAGMADPIGDELVASLARPGGNVTGNTFLGPELIAKRMGLLKETLPGLSRVAALLHSHAYGERTMKDIVTETETSARALGMRLQIVQAAGPNDIAGAMSAATGERAEALIVLPSPMLFAEHKRIVRIATESRMPAMYAAREFVDAGGLMSYGANLPDLFRRSATYTDKIIRGVKPADLPVEQPTKFEFVINLKAVKMLGLDMPPMLLARADEVIE